MARRMDMSRFPSDAHLASWAGVCPGNNESAGKRLSGKKNKGSTYLRNALVQSAWAASHTKETYLAAQFRRLVRTKGQKRAMVAVGHSILVIAYHILKRHAGYKELGGDYFDRQSTEHLQRRLIRRLERLGVKSGSRADGSSGLALTPDFHSRTHPRKFWLMLSAKE
jgi:transposase